MGDSAARKLDDGAMITSLLESFSLLQGFAPALVRRLAENSSVVEVPENTQILRQGQVNENLYFLLTGRLGVYVDGGRVSKLERRGDLLGEMSLITGKPAGATILSETAVTLIQIDSRIFRDMKGPEKDHFQSLLYRIYATVLAEKLSATNQKAKHFEELTLQLQATQAELQEINQNLETKVEERTQRLEQQNAALQASMRKLEELLNSKRLLVGKLSEFNRSHLAPLKAFLDEFRKQVPGDPQINDARRVVFDIQHLLGPLADQYASEQATQGKRVLFADANKKQQVIAKMALGGTGVELDMASTAEEARQKIEGSAYDLVIFDAQMCEVGNIAAAAQPHAGLVLMTSARIPEYLPALKTLNHTPHIVSRDEADRTFTVKNIVTTVTKLLSQDVFGLEKYLGWGVDIQSRPVTGSRERQEIINEVDEYFGKLGVRRANRDRIRLVLEELLMNAIYDAPTGADGGALYNHMPRTVELSLKPEEQGLVRFATDGMLIAVSVQDPFGSLKGSTILRYLENNYAGVTEDINAKENKGGAGRGLHQIVESSDLVVFNVEPGRRTEAIALFNVEVKDLANLNPSFHLFIKGQQKQ